MSARKLFVVGTALVASCAMTPEANNALESARSTYRMAFADPQVNLHAPVELQVAQRSLGQAENMWNAGGDPEVVAHLAYLAEQRSRIAMKTADSRKAEAAVATSSARRNRVLLEARTREAETAKLEADLAREQANLAREQSNLAREQADLQAKQAQQAQQQSQQQLMEEKRVAGERATLLASEVQRLQGEMSDLKARETERGWVLTLRNDLLFDSGKASLKPGGYKALENLAQFMHKQADREIAIEGFTDSTGSEALNRRLSEERAQAVKQVLVARGIQQGRIDARGYGPAFPVASNDTPVGRQLNRRVEVVVAPEPRLSSSGGATRR